MHTFAYCVLANVLGYGNMTSYWLQPEATPRHPMMSINVFQRFQSTRGRFKAAQILRIGFKHTDWSLKQHRIDSGWRFRPCQLLRFPLPAVTYGWKTARPLTDTLGGQSAMNSNFLRLFHGKKWNPLKSSTSSGFLVGKHPAFHSVANIAT